MEEGTLRQESMHEKGKGPPYILLSEIHSSINPLWEEL
jgi:hypothetical protein